MDWWDYAHTATGKKLKRATTATPKNQSPFGSEVDFMMSNARATELGFTFENLNDYLPALIKQFAKQ